MDHTFPAAQQYLRAGKGRLSTAAAGPFQEPSGERQQGCESSSNSHQSCADKGPRMSLSPALALPLWQRVLCAPLSHVGSTSARDVRGGVAFLTSRCFIAGLLDLSPYMGSVCNQFTWKSTTNPERAGIMHKTLCKPRHTDSDICLHKVCTHIYPHSYSLILGSTMQERWF